jgi:hypothetical protein
VERTDVLEEPISPELVLVDGELAARAREASADSPWLLPAVAEARQCAEAARPVAVEQRPAPEAPRRQPSFSGHLRATAVIGCVLVAVLAAVSLAPELVPGSAKPTLARRGAERAALAPPKPSTSKPAMRPPKAERVVKPKPRAAPKREPKPEPKTTKPKRSARPAPAPKPAAKPKIRAPVRVERVFSWRRYRGAVYYQVHLQRGAKTVYEARTLQRTASIRLKLRPGRYHAVVRPAIPSDVGIILGPTIMDKIVRI